MSDFKHYTDEEIRELPTLEYQGKIHLISETEAAQRAAHELLQHDALGFDTETRPNFVKGRSHSISLIQLSTQKETFLFRNQLFKMPNELLQVLESAKILKVGVALHDDVKGLQKLYPFKAQGMVDLAPLSDKLKIKANGLRGLTASVLNQRLSKKAKLTNWEAKNLTEDQLAYAALDAWAGLEIYLKLKHFL